jgi:hypothetical protein
MQGSGCVRQIECQQQPLFGGESPGFVEFFLLELLPKLTGGAAMRRSGLASRSACPLPAADRG